MTLNLLKLAVGADSIADLEGFQANRRGRLAHVTRMVPRRAEDLLDGGSLYWVIKGQIAVRQRLEAIEPFTDADGIGRCRLVLDRTVVRVRPRPFRAFQGWRYLAPRRFSAGFDEPGRCRNTRSVAQRACGARFIVTGVPSRKNARLVRKAACRKRAGVGT